MANPVNGELAFEVNGQRYTFVLGTYGLAALQRRTGVATFKFFSRKAGDWGIDDVLAVFTAGLLRHHKLSEEDAADLIDKLGQERVGEIIREGVLLAFPPDAVSKGGSNVRPIKATDETGASKVS